MKIVRALLATVALSIFGWWILIKRSVLPDPWQVSDYLVATLWIVIAIQIAFAWKTRRASDYREPSVAWSGTSVVLVTGFAAILFMGEDAASKGEVLLLIAIAALTAVVAFLVHRFASRNEANIGEARFGQTPNDGGKT